jgi:hypothetical protein
MENGLHIKEKCWRRASKGKNLWKPSKSEDTDPFFQKIIGLVSSKNLVFVRSRFLEK